MERIEPEYLGDAVYVSTDGHHIMLHLSDHDATPCVYLERDNMRKLIAYAHRVYPNL